LEKTFNSPLTISKKELLDPTGTTDKFFRQFLYDLSIASNQLEMARSYLASQLGVSAPQYNILMVIAQYQQPEGIGLSEVAKHLQVSIAHITNEIKKLNQLGFVTSDVNPQDRRVHLVKIHPEAESQFIELGHSQRTVNNALFANLSKTEFNQIRRILKKLIQDFGKTMDELPVAKK
jgi:DNA-binding MarR family transcriptional regulator